MTKANPNEPITRKILDEAVDAILSGMQRMFAGVDKKFAGVNERLDSVDSRLDTMNLEIRGLKNSVNGIKVELSDTPSRREHEKLKSRVDKYHPLA